jgi:hypothetical protein
MALLSPDNHWIASLGRSFSGKNRLKHVNNLLQSRDLPSFNRPNCIYILGSFLNLLISK